VTRISDERVEPFREWLSAHRKTPAISWQQHRRIRSDELWAMIATRRRIYLDTRYWVFLRDAAMGRAKQAIHNDLLAALQSVVESGLGICPLSESVLFELHKQTDPATRLAMARVMDSLSRGVTVQNSLDRLRAELVRFFHRIIVDQRIPGPPVEHVWTTVGHFLGSPDPVFDGIDSGEQLAISKAFFDFLWSVTLEELITDNHWIEHDKGFQEDALRMTEGSRAHASEITSFEELYLAEVSGFVDINQATVEAAVTELATALGQQSPGPDAARLWRNAVYNIVRFDRVGTGLPILQIVSGIHAAIRWQRGRPFKASDFYDMYHAAAALPYCDMFLTEAFMGTILKNPPLSFGTLFDTDIVWDEADALQLLRAL
jgi:hypothetical protein